ncbi:Os04g0582400 [Oryza sativa Japonica Group]|uniref:Os04g0582400 protein n=1 Tax=Oryza sativa subsp. japonica TaxID=39947 RepID=Q0JAR5_ORYSJ|nr:Os04g0582400 [Oryza sativa Japonica Group]|eukprot:NP_001053658.2 Os04g0582400 [Oryza sativa Japonica Group]
MSAPTPRVSRSREPHQRRISRSPPHRRGRRRPGEDRELIPVQCVVKEIALSIETLLDLDELTLEEVTGRLRNAEEKLPAKSSAAGGKLFLTEEQWTARWKEKQAAESSSGKAKSGGGNRRRRGGKKKAEAAAHDGDRAGRDTQEGREPNRDKCRNCGRTGHWAKDCRQPKRPAEAYQALADEDDDEPALLMAHVVDAAPVSASSSSAPPASSPPSQPDKTIELVEPKALYGLRQAPRAWNSKLEATLLSLGFRRNDCEHAVYVRGNTSARLLVGVYVDDLIITGTKEDEIVRFKGEMKALFKMSDLGLLSFYLGIEVEQVAGSIRLSQAAYARRILERAGMLGCNPSATPMEQRLKLSKTSAAASVNPTWYRGIVGCLRYLVHTRPDIAFSVGYVSRFMEAPTTEHEAAVKRILRYIAGTTEFGCHYHQSSSPVQLVGYSDADMAGDPDTRKSTTGVVFFLGTSPVSWQSVKQKVVALSSCEAEYIAATTAACQGVWLSQLLGEINQEEPDAFKLLIDNKSAIALSKNPVFHERSKHIATRYHYIRERVEDGSVHVEFVGTEGQIADILTKALGRTRFQELRSRIGVADVKFRCKT